MIAERRKYYSEDESYKMIDGDARESDWLTKIPYNKHAILVLEGISMYLTNSELKKLISNIGNHFETVNLSSVIFSPFTEIAPAVIIRLASLFDLQSDVETRASMMFKSEVISNVGKS